jgi:restriction endonuclease Mrr
MAEAYHFPPELMTLLVDCIPRLCKSKQNVIDFFKNSGTPQILLKDVQAQVKRDRSSLNKFEMTRRILGPLNETETDLALKARRTLLHRITTYDDFSSCWENNRMEARGLVASIRELVNVKDTFSRVKQQQRQERIHRNEVKIEKRKTAETAFQLLVEDLKPLYKSTDPKKRGKDFEGWLNRMFKAYGIDVREPFERRSSETGSILEQIDGVIVIDGDLILVEAKWTQDKTGKPDVSSHFCRVFARTDVKGLMVSTSGFTEAAAELCRDFINKKTMVLVDFFDIVRILDTRGDLGTFLRERIHTAALDKKPYVKFIPS